MTTFTDFVPSASAPFQFNPILDGVPYLAVVTWGLAGQRWYVNLYDQDSNRVFTLPRIESPTPAQTESLSWDVTRNLVTVTTTLQHGIPVGATAELTIANVTPDPYNGVRDLLSISPNMLTYPETVDPGGDAIIQGSIGRDINIAAGYLQTSTLVFREATQQFEVTP